MASVVDALVVTLGLDASTYERGSRQAGDAVRRTKEEARKAATDMEASGKRAAEFFSRIRNEALALFAVLIGASGIKQFVANITAADAAVGRMARNLGVATPELSAWQGAAERIGGSAEGVSGSLQHLASEMQLMAITGQSGIVPYLRALNTQVGGVEIAFVDLAGKARPVTDVMKDIADKLHQIARTDPVKANTLGRQLGFDQGTVNLLVQGRQALETALELQRRLGAVTEADTEAAQRLAEAWRDLSRVFTDTLRKALTALTPILSELMRDFAEFVAENKGEIAVWARDLAKWLKDVDWAGLRRSLAEFVSGAKEAADAVGGIVKIVEVLLGLWVGAKFLAALAAINSMAAAAGALVGGAAVGGGVAATGALMIGAAATVGTLATAAAVMHGGAVNEGEDQEVGEYKDKHRQAYDFFRNQGWSDEAAHGIATRLMAESKMDPTAVGDGGLAYGVAQWHPDRQEEFKRVMKRDIRGSSVEDQLRFVQHELTEGKEQDAGRRLRFSQSRTDAAEIVDQYYERSAEGLRRRREREAAQSPRTEALRRQNQAEDARQAADPVERARQAAKEEAWRRGDVRNRPTDDSIVRGSGAGSTVMPPAVNSTKSSSVDVQIGTVNVQTQATDAEGVARGLREAIDRNVTTPQFNTGLQ